MKWVCLIVGHKWHYFLMHSAVVRWCSRCGVAR